MEERRSSKAFELGRQLLLDHRMLAIALGYGLFRGANSLLYSSALVSLPFPALFISDIAFSSTTAISAILFTLVCVVLAWRGWLLDFKLPVFIPACILAAIGLPAVLMATAPATPLISLLLALVYGAASTCMNLAWMEMLAHQKLVHIVGIFALSMLVKGVVDLVFGAFGGQLFVGAIALLVLVSVWLLLVARERSWVDKTSLQATPRTFPVYRRGLVGVADAIVVSVVLEAIVSVLSGFSFSAGAASESGLFSVLGTLFAAATFCFVTVFIARTTDIERFYRYLFPILLALVVLLPLSPGVGPTGLLEGLLVLIYNFISFSTLYFMLRQVRTGGLQTYVFIGVITIMIRFAQLAFSAFGYVLGDVMVYNGINLYWIVIIVAVYGLSMLLLYLTRRRPHLVEERVLVVSGEDRFALRGQELRDTYKITARETEIMLHLARGRSAAFIAEELICSPATVRTHMKSIYTKLDVHSKQELIDLFTE